MAKDPVCGMLVDERQAAAKAEYQGAVYYFCSARCHQAFNAEPQKYLKPQSRPESARKPVP